VLELVRRRLAAPGHGGDFAKLAQNHGRLVEAIASGDPDAAGVAMHAHLASRRPANGSPDHAGKNGQSLLRS
jgi:DNA-binding FadR family transcriptional regulator